jgi:hypothetical protein
MTRVIGAVLAVTILCSLAISGCATLPAEGAYWRQVFHEGMTQDTNTVQTPADRMHTHRMVLEQDARSLIEDIDYIMLRDRPSRLSKWVNR